MGISDSPTLQKIYEQSLGGYGSPQEFLWKHRGSFVHYIQSSVEAGLLDTRFSRKNFKLEKLSYSLNPARDRLISPKDLAVLTKHLLKNQDGVVVETPQYFWMRLAMTHSVDKDNPTREALALYEEFSLKPHQTLAKYAVD